MRSAAPGETSAIPIVSKHAGVDKTLAASSGARTNAPTQARVKTGNTVRTPAPAPDVTIDGDEPESKASSVGASAALMSVCVLFSRITGFLRTWAMAFALGSSFLSSSYQVANNLPNMLYELVMGGMLVTAFLPVYISVKKKSGTKAGNAYASNLLTLVTIFLGVLSVLCMITSPPRSSIHRRSTPTSRRARLRRFSSNTSPFSSSSTAPRRSCRAF